MQQYMLTIISNYTEWNKISAEEKSRIMERYNAFVGRLVAEKRMVDGSPLRGGGRRISAVGEQVVVDGPYAESKEALAGYFIFRADNWDEALEIAKLCPALTHGNSCELYEMAAPGSK